MGWGDQFQTAFCFLRKLYRVKASGQQVSTIKTNSKISQTVDPKTCSILIFYKRVWAYLLHHVLLNSFAISLSFSVISFLIFIAFGRELDFFFCFPVTFFITCHVCLVSNLYFHSREAQQFFFDFILSFSKIHLQFLCFSSNSLLLFFKNLI